MKDSFLFCMVKVMNRTIAISLLLLFTNIPSPKLFAQEKLRVLSGERVRVWVSDMVKKPLSGTLVSLSTDTLVMSVKNQKAFLLLPINSVTKLKIMRGKKKFGVAKGAGLGFIAGALTGAIIGYNRETPDECFDSICELEGLVVPIYASIAGVLGILSGSFIGATLKRESWQEMPLAKLEVVPPESTKPQKQAPFAKALPQGIYFEALGSGLIYSINYDRMFTNAVGGRFGIMYFPSGTANRMSLKLPFTVNYLVGSSEHKLEMSAGVIVILDSREIGDLRKEGDGAGVAATLFYGYRYQPMKTGLLFRIGFSPIFTSNRFLLWGGLSLGVSF